MSFYLADYTKVTNPLAKKGAKHHYEYKQIKYIDAYTRSYNSRKTDTYIPYQDQFERLVPRLERSHSLITNYKTIIYPCTCYFLFR